MSVIGDRIKKYRIEKGITQEQLGQMLGVTTQGVSRWERGGTPDAEILPKLSEILEVSIDALYGREEKSLALSLARHISQLPQEDAFLYSLNVCWSIIIGLMGDVTTIDDFMNMFIERSVVKDDKKQDYFAKRISDTGMANMRLSPDFYTFFLMKLPKDGLKSVLADKEELRKIFALLADKKMLEIIFFIYSRPIMPIATSLISKNTGLEPAEVDRCMRSLCEKNVATHTVVATAEGEINSYMIRRESFVIPLLCFADELTKKDLRPFMGGFDSSRAFL